MTSEQLTADALGALVGVSAQQVRALARRGVVVRTGRGRYERDASVRGYVAHLRKLADERGAAGDLDLARERALLAKEQAEGVALRNAATRAAMVCAAAAELKWKDMAQTIAAGLLSIPDEARRRLPHLSDHDVEALRATIVDLANRIPEGKQ